MLVNGEKISINEIEKDNDRPFTKDFNFNERCSSRAKLCSDKEAESGAERYIRLLDAPECREFFLKVMYHLPYDTREKLLDSAKRPWIRSPKKFFTYCAKRELALLGY